MVGGVGRLTLNRGAGATASLGSVLSSTTEVVATLSTDKAPTGSGQYLNVIPRRVTATQDYRAKVRLAADGSVILQLTRMQSSVETTLTGLTVPGLTYAAGDRLVVRVQAYGTNPTTLRAKIWRAGQTEPSTWQVSATDSTAGLQAAGSVASYSYVSSAITNQPVVVTTDDLWVGPLRP